MWRCVVLYVIDCVYTVAMSDTGIDLEQQEDELLALHSIFSSDEFVRTESKPAGEIRVLVELPADFTVVLTEGK